MKRSKLEILDPEDIRKFITAAYDLLENFGVMVDNDEALKILEGGGARIDVREKIAYIPAGMVDNALETRPTGFAIYDQECKKSGGIGERQFSLAEVTDRLDTFTPVSLPEGRIKVICIPDIGYYLLNLLSVADRGAAYLAGTIRSAGRG